jgi:DNA-binding LacI/PurR family transcriptional regulator
MGEAANGSRAATIRDVAARAGVSKSLVSLVLQGAPHVSEARREAVMAAIHDLGYRPYRPAQSLARSRSRTIGVLLNDLRNPWFVELLEGLTTALDGAGLTNVLADSYTHQRVGRSSVQVLLDQGVEGLVVVGTTAEERDIIAAAAAVPVVLAGTTEPHVTRGDVVVNDDVNGARMATEHLVSLGHRRIAYLHGPGEVGTLRWHGHAAAMTDAGLDPNRDLESAGGMTEESGYAAARRVLATTPRPTAVVAFNDVAAVGVMSAAADAQLDVPGDLSVVGYDNTYLARIRHISLTCVDNGNFAVGVQAGRFINERLAAPSLPPRSHTVPTRLVVRGSTSRPAPPTE